MRNMLWRSFVIAVAAISLVQAADYLCTDDFCSYYLEKTECMPTSTACHIQNQTHSGEFFPGEVPCGCCSVCLQNLHEGDPCTQGSPDVSPPMLVCGPGLYCKLNRTTSEHTCQKMDHTECFREQILFDELEAAGEIGAFMRRPQCDGDGNYRAVKCNAGQTCFCVNPKGERVFGEAPYSLINELTMKCECSRMNDRFLSVVRFENPVLTARCQDDGSFDPLQCMAGKCVCVEPQTGSPAGSVTAITAMDYNRMACFDRKMHLEYKYPHDCEEIQSDLLQEIEAAQSQQFTLLGFDVPKCQPDGWFEAIQSNENSFFCVDKYNRKIEDFAAVQGTPEAEEMNCKCARTRLLLRKNNVVDLPQCSSNGNFEKVQCRGEVCYCVNDDGLQLSREVPRNTTLSC